MFGIRNWDSISLGTIGFAQVGRPEYEDKVKVEKEIITTFFNETVTLKIPDEFVSYARFKWSLNPHDFGSYWDFEIYYHRAEVDDWEECEAEDFQDKHQRFWAWANKCEDAMGEYEELLENLCNLFYTRKITMTIVHQTIDGLNKGLKAV